ncbi:MAG TPA: LytTR family DNA-binding domain-containing protein [Luteibaculaceae bacterium]|nr:LytTR family DNA-binding domain-containing protein [Luteibaculaceae bacterium]
MTALIIDDEEMCRASMHALLKTYCPDVEVIGDAATVSQGVQMARELQPDLVFLDATLPQKSGVDFLGEIPNPSFDVVFTTSNEEQVPRSLRRRAVDYLLKPLVGSELREAVDRAETKRHREALFKQMEWIINNLKSHFTQSVQLLLPTITGYSLVDSTRITRLEADKNYTFIHFVDGQKMLISKTLKNFEGALKDYGFVRIHQSHMVNLRFVTRYNKGRGGYVTMHDNSVLDVSRSHRDGFLSRLNRVKV